MSDDSTDSPRARASRANGKLGGAGLGDNAGPHADKRTYEAAALAQDLADRILAGKGIPLSPMARAGPVTSDDAAHLRRITGATIEDFQRTITEKTQAVAVMAIDLIAKKLIDEPDKQKLYELTGLFAVSMDKLAVLSGRSSASGQINIQVNNFGEMSRSQLLAQLGRNGESQAVAAPAIET